MAYETIVYEVAEDHVATITLDRPDKVNAFNMAMRYEFDDVWRRVRNDDDVHVVVLQGNGRGFSAGVDVTERAELVAKGEDVSSGAGNPFAAIDPTTSLGAKANEVWKPLICALHGIVAGGAHYWINDADIVICSDDATFFDPHVTYGMTSALEPIGLRWRIPLGEVMRWALMGSDERMSAERALQIGLVSEIVAADQLRARAHELAAVIAAKPPVATQGTVKAVWQSLNMTRDQALALGLMYVQLGNPAAESLDRSNIPRPTPRIR